MTPALCLTDHRLVKAKIRHLLFKFVWAASKEYWRLIQRWHLNKLLSVTVWWSLNREVWNWRLLENQDEVSLLGWIESIAKYWQQTLALCLMFCFVFNFFITILQILTDRSTVAQGNLLRSFVIFTFDINSARRLMPLSPQNVMRIVLLSSEMNLPCVCEYNACLFPFYFLHVWGARTCRIERQRITKCAGIAYMQWYGRFRFEIETTFTGHPRYSRKCSFNFI